MDDQKVSDITVDELTSMISIIGALNLRLKRMLKMWEA